MRLSAIMRRHKIKRKALATFLDVVPSTITHWLSQGEARRPRVATDQAITHWLEAQGVPSVEAARWMSPQTDEPAEAATPTGSKSHTDDDIETETADMLLRRQPIHQATRAHFRLACDPFARDLDSHDDVFVSADIRYVREALWTTARHGGLLAVVGESGSGKTTLLDDIEDRIARDAEPVVLVRPDVTGMEASDHRGRLMRVSHIQEAIIHALTPDASLRQSPEGRARQLRAALIGAREAGQRVCVAFDEAHAMPVPTLKHLKRLLEIKQGFSRLLSVILCGQSELGLRLSERNPEVREVVARCEVVTLDPMGASDLDRYLAHKLIPARRELADLIDAGGLAALHQRLGITEAVPGRTGAVNRAYPLLAGNLLAAALNLAADLGQPRVDANTVGRI